MSNILVTGGAGFIGSRYINYIHAKTSHNIICVDNMTYAANLDRINEDVKTKGGRFTFLQKDICDITAKDIPEVNLIVNFAAESHVDNSIKDGTPFINSNVLGVLNLLQIARDQDKGVFKKFVQVSTDEVYGDMTEYRGVDTRASESYPLKPSSYYSASKASAEHLVTAAHRTYGVPYLITRCCNNYGPMQDNEKFIPVVLKSMKEGTPIPVYGKGDQIREWIHVDKHVKVIHELSQLREASNTYNIGTGLELTNVELIELISKASGLSYEAETVSDRLGHDRKYSIDCGKLLKRMPYLAEELLPNIEGFTSFLNNESRN